MGFVFVFVVVFVLVVCLVFCLYKKNQFFSEDMLDIYSGKLKRDVDAISVVALTTEVCKAECQLLSNGMRNFICNHCKMAIETRW